MIMIPALFPLSHSQIRVFTYLVGTGGDSANLRTVADENDGRGVVSECMGSGMGPSDLYTYVDCACVDVIHHRWRSESFTVERLK